MALNYNLGAVDVHRLYNRTKRSEKDDTLYFCNDVNTKRKDINL